MRAHQRHLSIEAELTTNLNAQMRELKRLRDLVRKAQQSARRARSPAEKGRNASIATLTPDSAGAFSCYGVPHRS
jgi:hypothetical protein